MQLDLSIQGKLSIEGAILIDGIVPKVKKEYDKITQQLNI